MDLNAALFPQDLTNHVVCCAGALWACEDVYVIKVSHYKVSGRKLVLNLLEGGGKGDAEEPRHEGIPLLPALGTGHN